MPLVKKLHKQCTKPQGGSKVSTIKTLKKPRPTVKRTPRGIQHALHQFSDPLARKIIANAKGADQQFKKAEAITSTRNTGPNSPSVGAVDGSEAASDAEVDDPIRFELKGNRNVPKSPDSNMKDEDSDIEIVDVYKSTKP